MEQINRYARRELKEEEVYRFQVILCDNEIDRDQECFTVDALHKLAGLFLGKTGIFDHDPKGENQTARIYDTQVVADEARTTKTGEPYTYLLASAYMVRTEKNAGLILEIDAGIKKEVSVGCSVASVTCSICGTNLREKRCEHRRGEIYRGRPCYAILDQPSDAYEWSFVAVPAQPGAGVVKRYGGQAETETEAADRPPVPGRCRTPEELRKLFAVAADSLTLTAEETEGFRHYLARLEAEAAFGRKVKKQQRERLKGRLLLQYPHLSVHAAERIASGLSDEDLSCLSVDTGSRPQLVKRHEPEENRQQEFKI